MKCLIIRWVYRIACLSFYLYASAITGQNTNPNFDFENLEQQFIREYQPLFDFSVLVAYSDSIVYKNSFRRTAVQKENATSESMLFNVASISKSITAVGIMVLFEQQKLDLEDTIDDFFDQVPPDKKGISIFSLLSHRSGLGQTYPIDGVSSRDKALKIMLRQKLEFSPENGFKYSNQNYQLLAMIIEEVSGEDYETFIRNKVLLPLGMKNTYAWKEISSESAIAPLNKRIAKLIGKKNWGYTGSGGFFTTTGDLLNFWDGFYNNRILSISSRDLLLGNYFETNSGIQIGLGFFTTPQSEDRPQEIWTRGTESWGHNAVIRYYPMKDLTIIVATNSGEFGNDENLTGNRVISDLIAVQLLK